MSEQIRQQLIAINQQGDSTIGEPPITQVNVSTQDNAAIREEQGVRKT